MSTNRIVVGDFYLAPESESASRSAALLPTKGSEDVSSILGEIILPEVVKPPVQEREREYLPSKSCEWVVHAEFESHKEIATTVIADLFGKEWRARYGGLTIFGKDSDTGLWTFLISADGPKSVTGLQFAWSYFASWSESPEITTAATCKARLDAIKVQLKTVVKAEVHLEVTPDAAEATSRHLSELSERFDQHISLYLKAPSGKKFTGKDVWDVMLCLGLQWGDMDCFHWRNRSAAGGDSFFSASTSTPPGYFQPEEIAVNRVAVDDLVFSYSLPRSVDPAQVYERMFAAVQYAKKRLGGTVATAEGREPNPKEALQEIRETVKALDTAGFPPGSSEALRFF